MVIWMYFNKDYFCIIVYNGFIFSVIIFYEEFVYDFVKIFMDFFINIIFIECFYISILVE